ncbi:tetratricopeptide repeat protein [Lutimonas zeaxanthinifaciens]|uniref:tetratricopeptide repeat protein n=1 Tax=Lutimonas zeaxanthinifaciens TaxID=3060215 RepID=UPI00265CA94B|nr:tetratricopeptide repeat protein [Lutimonas sp. YSD2104]WKK65500.1 tetratricopeptide repeat protein [Lutimonas sp. YSD2104]
MRSIKSLKIKGIFVIVLLFVTLQSLAQSAELANSYYRKGEYEKAILLYKPLLEANPIRQDYFKNLLTCYQQIEDFSEAQTLIQNQLTRFPEQVYLYVELGYNHQLKDEEDLAAEYYERALGFVKMNPSYAFMIGRSFSQNHLLDKALETYSVAKELNPKLNTEISEARIYGEKGDLEKMFNLFLDLIDKNENYFSTVQRYSANFITNDKTDPNNVLFRNLLLKRAQSNPKDAWNILLSWLFMQQEDFKKALVQEKSLFRRKPGDLSRVAEIGYLSFESEDYDTAGDAFTFLVDNRKNNLADVQPVMLAELYLLKIENLNFNNKKEKALIEKKFEELIKKYGIYKETLELHLSYADFLTFDLGKSEKAIDHLEGIAGSIESPFNKGIVQMKIADILVFSDQFNQALILYTQIQYDLKNSELAQEARFKVARTSYFKGDFEWAQNQLKVLKSSTSQLIANDALELSLKIGNNLDKDSINEGLILFAKAELLGFQKKYRQAIDTLNIVLTAYKGRQIEDDALYYQAICFEALQEYQSAEKNLITILDFHPESLLTDDCLYKLGVLYRDQMDNNEKAKEMFERIIFEFPSSIYLVDARAAFRQIRGDDI